MRRAALLALAVLPLLGADCGGDDPAPPSGCTVSVGGEVSEQLWCAGNLFDFTTLDPPQSGFSIQLALYRGAAFPAGNVSIDLLEAPVVGASYGWNPDTSWSNVDIGDAIRFDGGLTDTHEAWAPDTGKLSLRFTALPPVGPSGAQSGFHGTLTATLPSLSTPGVPGTDVTFTATF